MIYYDWADPKIKVRNMPFYPDCNMRLLSEVNMTTCANDQQTFTMEQIFKNYKNSKELFDLGSPLSIVLYEMTDKKTDDTAEIITANIVRHAEGTGTLYLPDRFASAVKIKTLRNAAEKLQLVETGWIHGEFSDAFFLRSASFQSAL